MGGVARKGLERRRTKEPRWATSKKSASWHSCEVTISIAARGLARLFIAKPQAAIPTSSQFSCDKISCIGNSRAKKSRARRALRVHGTPPADHFLSLASRISLGSSGGMFFMAEVDLSHAIQVLQPPADGNGVIPRRSSTQRSVKVAMALRGSTFLAWRGSTGFVGSLCFGMIARGIGVFSLVLGHALQSRHPHSHMASNNNSAGRRQRASSRTRARRHLKLPLLAILQHFRGHPLHAEIPRPIAGRGEKLLDSLQQSANAAGLLFTASRAYHPVLLNRVA